MANSQWQQLSDSMQTPLNGEKFQTTDLVVEEVPSCTKINLRADFSNQEIVGVILDSYGLSPLQDANTCVSNAENSLFWLGPDERQLYSTIQAPADQVADLAGKLPAGKSAVVDVSDYYTVIRLSGSKSRQVLASGTPFDIHPREFSAGQCTQTRFGNASVLLSCQQDGQTYDLQVRWSYAEYLWSYLCKVSAYV